MEDCLFCKICEKKVKSQIAYEDDHVVAFRDVNPQAPTHILIVPRKHIPTLLDLTPEDNDILFHIYSRIKQLSQELGLAEKGFRVVVNCRSYGGQTVYHLHFHLLGGRFMTWPPG